MSELAEEEEAGVADFVVTLGTGFWSWSVFCVSEACVTDFMDFEWLLEDVFW